MLILLTTLIATNIYFIIRGFRNYINNSPEQEEPECICHYFAAMGYHHSRLLKEIYEKVPEGASPDLIMRNVKRAPPHPDFVDIDPET